LKKANCISWVFSVTKRSLRKPCSHDNVRSATQRNTPKPLPCSVFPFRELRLYPTLAQLLAVGLRVIRPIRVQLLGTTLRLTVLVLRPATVHHRQQFLDLRDVGGRDVARQGYAIGIDENVLLDAGASAIGGGLPLPSTPSKARAKVLSMAARV
jgi:hypothetical protein